MKILACVLAFIVSASCTLSSFGGGSGGGGVSSYVGAGVGKSKFGGGPYPPYPYPFPAFPFPFPFGPFLPPQPPQPQIVKVIHEHVQAPSVSKVIKVVHHQQSAFPAGWGDVQVLQSDAIPVPGPIPQAIPLESSVSLPSHLEGFQVLEGGAESYGHDKPWINK